MSERQHPLLVSIVIPVYNGANYLREAIDSALAQTYPCVEVLVIDDGSDDDGRTEAIARSYGDRIRYYRKENGGVSSALNYGIERMEGEYFSWLSHDDAYQPNKVSDAVTLLEQTRAEKLIAYTGGAFMDKDARVIRPFPRRYETGRVYSPVENMAGMLRHSSLNGCGLLIPREAFAECGGFDEKLRFLQDALMWYRMFGKGYRVICDNRDNLRTRLHAQQVTRRRQDLFRSDSIAVSEELIALFSMNSTPEFDLLYSYALRCGKQGLHEVVRACFKARRFGIKKTCFVRLMQGYGKVRQILRAGYYRWICK